MELFRARATVLCPPFGFLTRSRLAERQAILIEGVTRFVTRDARCNSVMQAVIPPRSFEVVGPATRLVQAVVIDGSNFAGRCSGNR